MPKAFGLPYLGSKSKLATRILEYIPSADILVDIFAGGMAISHAALLSGKYKSVIANDISDIPSVFVKALNGDYENEDRWISRSEFLRLRDKDPFIRLVWSFGNNLHDYMYSYEIEPFKKALHWAVYYGDADPLSREFGIDVTTAMRIEDRYQRWLAVKRLVTIQKSERTDLQNLTTTNVVQNLRRVGLENYERNNAINITRLQHMERLQHFSVANIADMLTVLQGDYQSVKIPPNAVVYADPPYKGVRDYQNKHKSTFDYESFYAWCRNADFPLFISEYQMPDDFVCIAQFHHRATNGATAGRANNAVVEKLFVHEKCKNKVVQNSLFLQTD